MKNLFAIASLVALGAVAAAGQPTMTNGDLIKLSKSGLSNEFITNLVDQQGSRLSGDVYNLIDLKNAGVNETVLGAVSRKNPPREALNTESVVSLTRAGFSDNFIADLLMRQPSKFNVSTSRILELRQAGVSERLLNIMLGQSNSLMLPNGSEISVRLIDSIDSEKDNPGKQFRASLQDPIVVNNEEIAPKGADAMVVLAEEKGSGKITGKTALTVQLASVSINGQIIPVVTSSVMEYSKSRTARTAKSAAAVGIIGAIIGGIAGGGQGAAIGAGAGAAAGAGAQVFMKGQRVRIPSETVLTFTTQQDVKVR